MTVSVLVPFRSSDEWRDAALVHVLDHYRAFGWETHVGTAEGPWCKARAVADAARDATGDVFVVADADCICAGTPQAVQTVLDGAAWAMPHRKVHRLDSVATTAVYDGAPLTRHLSHVQPAYTGIPGGGIVVLTPDTWDRVPLDPRFEGWGQEDDSWAHALTTLAGRAVRLEHDLYHLYHPPQPRLTRRIGSTASKQLGRRYHAARNNPMVMAALIDEGRLAWTRPT